MMRARAAALLLLPAACSAAPPRAAVPKPAVDWVPSAHFREAGRGPGDVDAVVIHTTEGSYDSSLPFEENHRRVYRGSVGYLAKNDREVSAHFVVGPGGEITQMVEEKDVAHTTTYYNARSFGIECAGWAGRKETWNERNLAALADLTAYLCDRWGVPAVHPEGDAVRGPLRATPRGWLGFDAPGIIGHVQVQTAGSEAVKLGKLAVKTDPGPHFPWERFIGMVRERQARAGFASTATCVAGNSTR